MEYIKWIWEHMKGYRTRYMIAIFIAIINPLTLLINPQLQGILVDEVIMGGPENHDRLIPLVVTMVLVTLVRTTMVFLMIMLTEQASQGLVYNLRLKLYDKLQKHDRSFYNRFRTGDLMTTSTSDVEMIRHNTAYVFREILSSSLSFIFATIFFLSINVKFTLVMMAISPLIFVASRMYMKNIGETYVEIRARLSELNTLTQENIEGNRIVKAFANEDFEIERFDDRNKAYRDQVLKAEFLWLRFYPYIEFLGQSMTITTLLFGALFMMNGTLTPGEYTIFTSLSWVITDPFRILGGLLNDLKRFFASTAKVMELMTIEPSIVNAPDAITKKEPIRGDILFDNVSFSFGRTTVLDNVSFKVEPGQTIAFMGETGTGKTTLVNLITRFYDVKKGAIVIDGVDVRKWNLQTLRGNIGMSMQDVFLFSDTVDSNIAYGDPELPVEDVKKYATVAAADFIESMPYGYNTIIGERGVGLSGGQKQRLALARALALEPSILILDDTTSAVDMETEQYIQRQLNHLDFECTKIIIAQRVSSVKNADQIYILGDGKIVEHGTHDQLVEKQGYYHEVYEIQSGLIKGGVVGG